MSAGVQLSAPLLAKARETRFTKFISALAREVGGSADRQDVQELLTHRLMTLHAQLTEAWYSVIGALLAAEAEAQALADARLEASVEAALPPLLRALAGDPLRAILKLLGGADLTCARLACRDFHDHSSPAHEAMLRSGFLRTRALAVYACEHMPAFMLAHWRIVCLAASVCCVGALEELVDHRQCELTVDACAAAALNGQLDALTWLRSRGCPWYSAICSEAAFGGHLEVLRYAHEHGCPWDESICYIAAQGGDLGVMQYAHEHSCPIDVDECLQAADHYGHAAVVEYLLAAHEGYAAVVEYLLAAQPVA
ncbi:hypothetical protein T492DRAFT_885785 [Pavlovales sp. CCMP2436]|nr:hypothetical protein T492DRAFT_885785 [Pavlovales sp. CCMP2436]